MDTNEEKAKPNTLTPAQRARKRAADRKFRKSSREKTKSYIAHLEKLVEASSTSSNGSETVQHLMQQARESYDQARQLRSALANIIELAQSNLQRFSECADKSALATMHVLTSSEEVDDQDGFRSPTENSDKEAMGIVDLPLDVHQFTEKSGSIGLAELLGVSEPLHPKDDGFAPFISKPLNPDQMEPKELYSPGLAELLGVSDSFQRKDDEFSSFISKVPNPDKMEPEITNAPDPSLSISNITFAEESYSSYKSVLTKTLERPELNISQPSTTNDSQSIWSSLGIITYAALSSSKKIVPSLSGQLQRAHDENVLITAVVHGWHSVREQDLFDPTWQAIRRIDEQILRPYRTVEKLAMLYVLRLQFLYLLKGEYIYEVPTFMHPRPSQTIIDHLPHAECYVWPGFREHLFVWPQKYSRDKCLAFMGSCFRFSWFSDPQNLYVFNSCTGLYALSAEFTKRLNDLRCWTVEPRFFEIYPELQGEIPAYNSGQIDLTNIGLWPPEACQMSPQEPRDEFHENEPPFAAQHDTIAVSQRPIPWGIWNLSS